LPLTLSKDLAKLLLEEARTVAKLRHPNIVRVLTADTHTNDGIYIAMDWIEGQTLQKILREEHVSIGQSIQMMEKVADAVHAAHKAGYVHRDLKPANILIDGAGEPFVTDFGLAINETSQRNHRNEVAGTLSYMSPEQVRGESHYLDGRTDVWALGVMLYELLTGRKPFSSEHGELPEEICKREPKPIRLLNEKVDEVLATIVDGCLRKDVTERTGTAGQVADALRQLHHEDSQRENSDTIRIEEPPKNQLLLVSCVTGVIFLVAAVSFLPSLMRADNAATGTSDDAPQPPADSTNDRTRLANGSGNKSWRR
jgi:serine/threonine protein kinase